MTTVRVATTTSGTLLSSFEDTDVIDGVTLSTGDYILIKDQATQTENGVYIVQASGTPLRLSSFRTGKRISAELIYVIEGTLNGFTEWTCANLSGSDIVGTDNLIFTNTGVTEPVDETSVQTLTNKTITDSTNNVVANALRSATTVVDVSSATAPTAGQILTALNGTSATWQSTSGTISSTLTSSTLEFNTTSTAFVVISGMTTTPGAGKYLVIFSASGSVSEASDARYQVFTDGTAVPDSFRRLQVNNSSKNITATVNTQTITTVQDGEVVEMRALTSAGTLTIFERSMVLIKLS